MARSYFQPALFSPFLLWTEFAMKATEMLVSSSQVIATRVDRIARAGANPSQRDRKEFMLMGSEKLKAANQSSLAVATQLQSANYELMGRAWQQWMAAIAAMGSLASSRSFGEALSRQSRLMQSLARSHHSHSRLSSDAARLASAALEPVHAAATANARRLARTKTRASRR